MLIYDAGKCSACISLYLRLPNRNRLIGAKFGRSDDTSLLLHYKMIAKSVNNQLGRETEAISAKW